MADWSDSLVALTTPYADLLPRLRDRDKDVATGFQVGTPSNLPESTLRFNVATGRMERWESGAWAVKVIAVGGGGTGASTASAARANLGAGAAGDALFTAATASAARATLGAGATGDALFTAATAAAARTTLGATSVGGAVFTATDAAAARAAIAAFGTAGGDLTGNVAILAQSGADSQLRIDGDLAAGRRTILLMRRGGQARLLLWVGEAETGANAGSNAELYTYDDGGGAQRVWRLVRATRVLAFDAIPEGPATDPSSANQLARKAYVDAQRDTRVARAGDTLGGVLLFPAGSAAEPSISFDGDPDTGLFRAAADNLQITVGGQSVFRVTNSFVQTTRRLALPGNAANPLDAVPKQQLDAAIAASGRLVVLHDTTLGGAAGSMNFTIPDENAVVRVLWANVNQTSIGTGLALRWDVAFDTVPTWVAGPIQLQANTTGELWRGWWEFQNFPYSRKQAVTANSWETIGGSQHAALLVPNNANRVRNVRLVALGATAIAAGARVIIVQERLA